MALWPAKFYVRGRHALDVQRGGRVQLRAQDVRTRLARALLARIAHAFELLMDSLVLRRTHFDEWDRLALKKIKSKF